MSQSKRERWARERASRRRRALAFAAIVVLVIGAASWLLAPALPSTVAGADPNMVTIEADMAGFTTKVITAKVGQPLTVRLRSLDNEFHSDGGGKHQFAIDELGVNSVAPPEGTSQATGFWILDFGLWVGDWRFRMECHQQFPNPKSKI